MDIIARITGSANFIGEGRESLVIGRLRINILHERQQRGCPKPNEQFVI